jgi:hypothetical protein
MITNLPLRQLIGHGGSAEVDTDPASVDDIFLNCPTIQRLGVDTMEVVHRPEDTLNSRFLSLEDHCTTISGDGTVRTHIGESASDIEPRCFGFAWRGVSPGDGTSTALSFELLKNIEWRPRLTAGIQAQEVKSSGESKVQRTLATLDKHVPNWQTRILDSAGSLAGAVVKIAATGIASEFAPILQLLG